MARSEYTCVSILLKQATMRMQEDLLCVCVASRNNSITGSIYIKKTLPTAICGNILEWFDSWEPLQFYRFICRPPPLLRLLPRLQYSDLFLPIFSSDLTRRNFEVLAKICKTSWQLCSALLYHPQEGFILRPGWQQEPHMAGSTCMREERWPIFKGMCSK